MCVYFVSFWKNWMKNCLWHFFDLYRLFNFRKLYFVAEFYNFEWFLWFRQRMCQTLRNWTFESPHLCLFRLFLEELNEELLMIFFDLYHLFNIRKSYFVTEFYNFERFLWFRQRMCQTLRNWAFESPDLCWGPDGYVHVDQIHCGCQKIQER